jgi:hypothetical protein
VVFGVLQAARRHVQEVKRDVHIDFRYVLKTAPLHKPHGRVDNCLCGKPMGRTIFKAKNIANQVEGPDLAATVGQQLVAPNRTLYDLVDVVRWLRFAVDFPASIVLKLA